MTRLLLGFLFFSTGIMKLTVPTLWRAWSLQLTEARIPFLELNLWMVPFIEIGIGTALVVGYFSRVAGAIVIPIMLVASYVHVVVDNPDAFPLQPSEPIIPLVVLPLAALIVWRGAGAWSLDAKADRRS